MVQLDYIALVVVAVGLVLSVILFAVCLSDWRRTHKRWAFRATMMSVTAVIVFIGSGATLSVRIVPGVDVETVQMIALGSRMTLLALVVWLILVRRREMGGS